MKFNDEPIHEQLIEELLLVENLRSKRDEIRKFCLGRSDRAGLTDLLTYRGRPVSHTYLDQLIQRKSIAYQQRLEQLEELPIYPGLYDCIQQLQAADLKLGVVTGAIRSEVEQVLNKLELMEVFSVIVTGDEMTLSKPEPEGYLLAVQRLNQLYPDLNVQPGDCLALEDTFVGIIAAQRAGIQGVGIAHTYPLHLLQRWANWAVDRFSDLELERIQKKFSQQPLQSGAPLC